ncbi:MAG: hypothetical protein JWP27_1515 [Flaviaesturariibacter sp.]|nr:hypothetical protein [Flaviaesturariibacter sp.]
MLTHVSTFPSPHLHLADRHPAGTRNTPFEPRSHEAREAAQRNSLRASFAPRRPLRFRLFLPYIFHMFSIYSPYIFHIVPIYNAYRTHMQPILYSYCTHIVLICNAYPTHTRSILNAHPTHIQPIYRSYDKPGFRHRFALTFLRQGKKLHETQRAQRSKATAKNFPLCCFAPFRLRGPNCLKPLVSGPFGMTAGEMR